MSCDELDRLLAESPHGRIEELPKEAREHLTGCDRCSRLNVLLDSAQAVDFPLALQHRIEEAILPGLQPVSPLASPFRVMLSLFVCSIAVITAANWHLGIMGWRARSPLQISVDFTLLTLFFLLLAGALAQQMMPGSRRTAAPWLIIAAFLLALLVADGALFEYRWNPDFVPIAFSCWEIGVTCAAVSAPLIWLMLRRGFFLNPVLHGATAGLITGLIGVTVLEIYCPYLNRLHISVAHIGAAFTATLTGAMVGKILSKFPAQVT